MELELYECLDIPEEGLNDIQKNLLMEIRWLWECMIRDIAATDKLEQRKILIKLGKDMILSRNAKLKKMMAY